MFSTTSASPAVSPLLSAARWSELAWDCTAGHWLAPAAVAQRAERRARTLLGFARTSAPLHAQRLHDLPSDTQRLRWRDVPVLTKRELMQDLEASLTDRSLRRADIDAFLADPRRVGELFLDRYAVWTSSGTSGTQGIFVHDADALAVYDALDAWRFRGPAPLAPGWPLQWAAQALAQLWNDERYVMLAATGGHFAGVSTVERLRRSYPWLSDCVGAVSLLQPLPQLVAELNRCAPHVLATYPTAALMLADAHEAGLLHLPLRELWTGGETLTDADRARLQRVFGCRVRNAYGASECMSIAWDCPQGRMHVNADWAVLEPVDRHYEPVPVGVASHTVLLTNLANRAQPLIRYDLGDSITLLEDPCPCGCRLPSIRIEGRHDDVLQLPAPHGTHVTLLPLVLATAIEDEAGVFDYQVVQVAPACLQLRLGPTCDAHAAARARHAIAHLLRTLGGSHVQVEIGAAPPLRSPHSGKLRRVLAQQGAGT